MREVESSILSGSTESENAGNSLSERASLEVRVPWRSKAAGTEETDNSSRFRIILRLYAWGHSSVGRALAWHARGRRFDPVWLHLKLLLRPRWRGTRLVSGGCSVRVREGALMAGLTESQDVPSKYVRDPSWPPGARENVMFGKTRSQTEGMERPTVQSHRSQRQVR